MPRTREYWWGLPAVLIGALAMIEGDVGIARAAANVAFFALGLGAVVWMRRTERRPGPLTGCLLCAALLVTFLGPGVDGVHRWIEAGPLSLNVSMLVAPWLLAVIAHLLARDRVVPAAALAVVVGLVHLLQPDAAQGAAFAIGAVVLLLAGLDRPSPMALAAAAAVAALSIVTFARRDPAQPVLEVEGIVGLAGDTAALLGVLAVAACALVAVPFVRSALHSRTGEPAIRAGQAAVCAYVVVQLLAPVALHVPVPVMGYGASTVLAFAAAFTATLAMPRVRSRFAA